MYTHNEGILRSRRRRSSNCSSWPLEMIPRYGRNPTRMVVARGRIRHRFLCRLRTGVWVKIIAELIGEGDGWSWRAVEADEDEALSCHVCVDFEEGVFAWIKIEKIHILWGFVEASSWEVRPKVSNLIDSPSKRRLNANQLWNRQAKTVVEPDSFTVTGCPR